MIRLPVTIGTDYKPFPDFATLGVNISVSGVDHEIVHPQARNKAVKSGTVILPRPAL